jgi:predicted glycosyltransferase
MTCLSPNLDETRPRVLIYVQDSWGFGHIQRVSKLARAIQNDVDCLILCGHREAGWLIPEKCEYLRIPSLNTPLSKGSGGVFWGRRSFLHLSRDEEIRLRLRLMEAAFDEFSPDVVIVENRPLGMSDELGGLLARTTAVKLFLTRGIMTSPLRVRSSFLNPDQLDALRCIYSKVIVAADRRIWDLAAEYNLEEAIASKLNYCGHFSEPIDQSTIAKIRTERGVSPGQKWIICSAGGGALGERLVSAFLTIAGNLHDVVIDVVQGPHSGLPWEPLLSSSSEMSWGRLHRECRELSLLHASADVVVCPGGSSLLEALEGGASIVTISVQAEADDDQGLLSSRLAAHYPITILRSYDELAEAVTALLRETPIKRSIRDTRLLNFDGLQNARDLILSSVRKR